MEEDGKVMSGHGLKYYHGARSPSALGNYFLDVGRGAFGGGALGGMSGSAGKRASLSRRASLEVASVTASSGKVCMDFFPGRLSLFIKCLG